MSKRLGSKYRSGRSPDWLKFENPAALAVVSVDPFLVGARPPGFLTAVARRRLPAAAQPTTPELRLGQGLAIGQDAGARSVSEGPVALELRDKGLGTK